MNRSEMLTALADQVVTALPGYAVATATVVAIAEDEPPSVTCVTWPVLAFRIPGGGGPIMPITLAGEPHRRDEWVLVNPDGSTSFLCPWDGDSKKWIEGFDTVERWKADVLMQNRPQWNKDGFWIFDQPIETTPAVETRSAVPADDPIPV